MPEMLRPCLPSVVLLTQGGYDFDLQNHSVLPTLLRCYDFHGGSRQGSPGRAATASKSVTLAVWNGPLIPKHCPNQESKIKIQKCDCCDLCQKCCDLCCDLDPKNHSVLPTLLRRCDLHGGITPSLPLTPFSSFPHVKISVHGHPFRRCCEGNGRQ
jgi:hypothetical protein